MSGWQDYLPDPTHAFCTTASFFARKHFSGTGAIIYGASASMTVNLDQLTGPYVQARWFDPTTGLYTNDSASPILASAGAHVFAAHGTNAGGATDWVLRLDSTAFATPDIASHDFQDGTVGPFTNPYGSSIAVIDDPTGAGFGKVCRMLYHVDGGTFHADSNTSLSYNYPASVTDAYARIYVYFPDPGVQDGVNVESILPQRKLIYINAGEGTWDTTISRYFDGPGGVSPAHVGCRMLNVTPPPNFIETQASGGVDIALNTWYYFELRVKVNTPGSSNGIIQVWGGIRGAANLANALLYNLTSVNVRESVSTNYLSVRIGQQFDRFGNYTMDDTRYLKNVALSTQRIGP